MTEGDEDMPNSSKKTKREGVKRNPGKSCPVNLLNSNMICSQGTPSSLNKVLSIMPGSLRSYLLQYVQPNHNIFQTPVRKALHIAERRRIHQARSM